MVIGGVGIFSVRALADDGGNTVQNRIHILFSRIIGRHIGALHDLCIRLAQLRIQLLDFLLIALSLSALRC